jgi:hypothetical protein
MAAGVELLAEESPFVWCLPVVTSALELEAAVRERAEERPRLLRRAGLWFGEIARLGRLTRRAMSVGTAVMWRPVPTANRS